MTPTQTIVPPASPEPKKKFIDITIEGQIFRIGRLSALNGNYVATSLQAARTNEEVFRRCQCYILDICSVYKDTSAGPVPMKLFDASSGKWMMDGFDDFDLVNQLYEKAVEFNFTGFFLRFFAKLAAAKKAEEEAQATDQQNSPKI